MVADPNMSMKILQLIIANHIVPIAHHLEHQHVLAMRQDKRSLFACGSIIRTIEAIGVLIDDLVFNGGLCEFFQLMRLLELFKNIAFHSCKIVVNSRRRNLQSLQLSKISQCGHVSDMINLKGGMNVRPFHFASHRGIEVGDGQKIILFEDLLGHTQFAGNESDSRDATAFPVAPVAHLREGLQEMPACDLVTTGNADDAAAPFGFHLALGKRLVNLVHYK